MNILQINPLRFPLIPIRQLQWLCCRPPDSLFELPDADVYVALTFGIGPDGSPGQTNEQIAEAIVFQTSTNASRPVIAQKEVYDALPPFFKKDHRVFCIPGPNERKAGAKLHRHSFDSVDDVLAICDENNWRKVALFGQEHHMPRVMWCFNRRDKAVVYVHTGGIGFCPGSTQRWCRNAFTFISWELCLAIPWYTPTGKI